MLGNMSVAEIEKRTQVKFDNDLVEFLNATRQHDATHIGAKEWHCFDIPFTIVCGSSDFCIELHDKIKSYGKDMKAALQISHM